MEEAPRSARDGTGFEMHLHPNNGAICYPSSSVEAKRAVKLSPMVTFLTDDSDSLHVGSPAWLHGQPPLYPHVDMQTNSVGKTVGPIGLIVER